MAPPGKRRDELAIQSGALRARKDNFLPLLNPGRRKKLGICRGWFPTCNLVSDAGENLAGCTEAMILRILDELMFFNKALSADEVAAQFKLVSDAK